MLRAIARISFWLARSAVPGSARPAAMLRYGAHRRNPSQPRHRRLPTQTFKPCAANLPVHQQLNAWNLDFFKNKAAAASNAANGMAKLMVLPRSWPTWTIRTHRRRCEKSKTFKSGPYLRSYAAVPLRCLADDGSHWCGVHTGPCWCPGAFTLPQPSSRPLTERCQVRQVCRIVCSRVGWSPASSPTMCPRGLRLSGGAIACGYMLRLV